MVLKIAPNTWECASRDKRELSVYRELGCDVLVMAKGEEDDWGRKDRVDGFDVLRYTTRPLGTKVPNAVNRVAAMFQWAHYARKLGPDVISGHDLLPGLTIGWLSTLFMAKKPKLVYDAHEFEIGRNTGGKRKKLGTWMIAKLECFMMKRCAFSIVVNDFAADEMQKIHRLKERPVVVKSTPNRWEMEECLVQENRRDFMAQTGCSYLLMSHGMITGGRGLELLLEALGKLDEDVGLVLLGDGDEDYLSFLRSRAEELGVAKRLLIHKAVPLEVLGNYIAAADLEAMPIEPVTVSYYHALPNKFFESIQAEVPMVASALPSMKRIIDDYDIGLTNQPGDVDDFCRCVEQLRNNTELYGRCKENLKRAKEEFCWEKEKLVLEQAFQALRKA